MSAYVALLGSGCAGAPCSFDVDCRRLRHYCRPAAEPMIRWGCATIETYGKFAVFPAIDKLPVWRDATQGEPIAVAGRRQRLQVVRREGDLYRIRLAGVGYGYVRADDVIPERDAKMQAAAGTRAAYAGTGAVTSGLPDVRPAISGDPLTGFAPVGFMERFFAYLIDFLILFGICYVIALLLDVQRPGIHTQTVIIDGTERERWVFTWWAGSTPGVLMSFAAAISYWIGGWAAFGATPGKMLMGQRIVHAQTEGPIGLGASTLRFVGTFISSIPVGLGYLWIVWDGKKQGWHDKIANTRVIRTR